ncbi:MAG: HlyD family efflux transporter periplasmic adaptor subunit [Candidatus Liberibacter ctenarytainae]|uniref:HlyD family efflux transporter periplasmic adaptor subunit n=1 Tax=Candidatus Liberibacter ctenarytainae TaxID=2020335 RepID=A0A937DKU0_9HYPH|nr:HlyD family efflux transporter periplasmic adaptor subunit [Candidatus Liberibacter ctenarytainae]
MYNFFWKNWAKTHFTLTESIALLSSIGTIILIALSILIPIETRVFSLGEIVNDDDIIEIRSPFSGTITQFLVDNGAKVRQGDPLFQFEDIETSDLINITKSRISDLQCHIDTANDILNFLKNKHLRIKEALDKKDPNLLIFLNDYSSTCSKIFDYEISILYESLRLKLTRIHNTYSDYLDLDNKIALSQTLLLSHKKDLTIMGNLAKNNIVSKNDLRQQERTVYKSELDLIVDINTRNSMLRHIEELRAETNIELAHYLKETSHKLDENQRTIMDEHAKLIVLEKKLSKRTILSPITGTVVYTQSFTSSNYVQQSYLLMKIAPHSNLTHIRAQVTPQQIQNVKHGDIALIHFSNYSDLREIQYKAIIDTINPIMSQQDNGLQKQNYYEVILKITDPSFLEKKVPIHNGASVEILFTAEHTTIAKEIIHPITKNWSKIFER